MLLACVEMPTMVVKARRARPRLGEDACMGRDKGVDG